MKKHFFFLLKINWTKYIQLPRYWVHCALVWKLVTSNIAALGFLARNNIIVIFSLLTPENGMWKCTCFNVEMKWIKNHVWMGYGVVVWMPKRFFFLRNNAILTKTCSNTRKFENIDANEVIRHMVCVKLAFYFLPLLTLLSDEIHVQKKKTLVFNWSDWHFG